MPQISIIVPVYNVESYVGKCLDSILFQTFSDMEILCLDDGSTDASGRILDEYAAKDTRVKVYHKKNTGYGNTMNCGLRMAQGKYIGIVESDDMITENMYETLYAVAEEHKLDVVKSDFYQLWNRSDGTEYIRYQKLTEKEDLYHKVLEPNQNLETYYLEKFTWNALYNREFLLSNHILYHETPGASYQDNGFWFQTFYHAKRVMFLPQAFYKYKQDNPNSSIHSTQKVHAMQKEYDFIRDFLQQQGETRKELYQICFQFRLSGNLYTLTRIADEYKISFAREILAECRQYEVLGEACYDNLCGIDQQRLEMIQTNLEENLNRIMDENQKAEAAVAGYSHVIIYGAGCYGKMLLERLGRVQNRQFCIDVAVSQTSDEKAYLDRYEIKNIQEFAPEREECLVILGVKPDSVVFFQMLGNVAQMGFTQMKTFHDVIPYDERYREKRLYSFDVFDTLITRDTAKPDGIFALMQDTLKRDAAYGAISRYIADNFFELRIGAEKQARNLYARNGCEDVTLEQIYSAMAMTGCISPEEEAKLAELERRLEIAHIRPVPYNISILKQLLARGKRVILISDMYLEQDTIHRMLGKADAVLESLPLYVSSEYKVNKATGRLFAQVHEKERIPYEEWIHYGDNEHSDVRMARCRGIQAEKLPAKRLLPCEEAALDRKHSNSFYQLTIGASVNARFLYANDTTAYAYGTSIGICIAYPYIWWMIQESVKKKIKRLYFIARDGYLLKQLADHIIAVHGYEIQTEYIYGSRRVWRLTALSQENFDLLALSLWSNRETLDNIDKVARLFELDTEELFPFVLEGYRRSGTRMTYRELYVMMIRLQQNHRFRTYVIERQKEKRDKVIQYLKESIDVTDKNFAFVELIGSGYTQKCLSLLMKEVTTYPVNTFFYQVDMRMDSEMAHYYCYVPTYFEGSGVMETLYTAPHGQTVGYQETENGQIVPLLEQGNEAILAYGFMDYKQGIENFQTEYGRAVNYLVDRMDCNELSMFYRKYMYRNPDVELLAYIGDMPYKASGRETKPEQYAPVLTEEMIRGLFLMKKDESYKEFYPGHNLQLSLLRCTIEERQLIDRYQKMADTEEGRAAREEYLQSHSTRDKKSIGDITVDMLEKRIIIYGAGKYGTRCYEMVSGDGIHEVVLWVDKNQHEEKEQVSSLECLWEYPEEGYDQIVIAILNGETADAVEQELVEKGIRQERIVRMNQPIWW